MPKCSGGQKVVSPQDLSCFSFAHSLPIISPFPYFTPKMSRKINYKLTQYVKKCFSKGGKKKWRKKDPVIVMTLLKEIKREIDDEM